MYRSMSPNLDWSDVFLVVRLELWVFEKNTSEAKQASHQLLSRSAQGSHSITGDVNLHRVVIQYLTAVCTMELLCFPFYTLWFEASH